MSHLHRLSCAALIATVFSGNLALAGGQAADTFQGRGFTVRRDAVGRLLSLKAQGKGAVFTDQDFALLEPEKQIVSLELSGDFTAAGVAHLAGKTSIEKLSLGSPALTDEASKTIATLTGLKDLELFGNLTSEWGAPLEGKLPNLAAITVNGRAPEKRGFNFPRDTAAAFRYLPSFPNLRAFNPKLHHVYYINNEVIKTFGKCPNLERTVMGGATWGGDKTQVDYSPLLQCKKLNTFTQFHAALYHDPTCAILAQLPNMHNVTLDFVTDEGAKQLAQLKHLESLKLGDSLLSPEGVKALSRCQSLRRLQIGGPWSYAILDALKDLRQLESLDWAACYQGEEAEKALHAALPKTKLTLGTQDAASLKAAWEKSTSRLRRQKQLEPFLRAAEEYRAAHPLP